MSGFPAARASKLAATDIDAIPGMQSSELYALGDELAAMIRHPATQLWDDFRIRAGRVMSAIATESWRRWEDIARNIGDIPIP